MSSITLLRPGTQRAVEPVALVARTQPRFSPTVSAAVGWTAAADVGYRLLGDPSVTPEILRDLIIVTWHAAPALFARSRERLELRNRVLGRP
jgi:hypothetical protein